MQANAGPGRTWVLIEVILPPQEMPLQKQDVMIVPAMLDGDHEATVGFAEVRSDGTIDLTLNQIRVTEPLAPINPTKFTHVSINITYQGLCAHRKA